MEGGLDAQFCVEVGSKSDLTGHCNLVDSAALSRLLGTFDAPIMVNARLDTMLGRYLLDHSNFC